MLACWVRKGANMTTEASPLPGSKETKRLQSGVTGVCVFVCVCVLYVFQGVFSNPGLYCVVVQLEVKQLFYCGRE